MIPFWFLWESPEMRCEEHSKEEICGIFPHQHADHDSHFHTHKSFSNEIVKACFLLKRVVLLGMYEIMKVCLLTIK